MSCGRQAVETEIPKRLKKLDLRHDRTTDEGVRILTECPDLKNLEFLDLVRNGIGKDGERLLRRSKVTFDVTNQFSRREFDQQDYLLDGDGENQLIIPNQLLIQDITTGRA